MAGGKLGPSSLAVELVEGTGASVDCDSPVVGVSMKRVGLAWDSPSALVSPVTPR